MAAAPNDGVCFVPFGGCSFAFLGVIYVGAVRERQLRGDMHAAEWISFLCEAPHGRPAGNWRGARDLDGAKDALRRHVAQWYDAAHTPLAPGQGERLAAQARAL